MQRIIHPIGQGAFYSERFDKYNIVYDCGEWKKSKKSRQFVEKTFSSGEQIDVLFISHFDYDHVSLIPTLKQNFTIKICILPVIKQVDMIVLSNYYKAIGENDLANLVLEPNTFFDQSTKIVYVDFINKTSEKEERIFGGRPNSVNIDNLKDESHIISGTELYYLNTDWIFVPYNIDYENRRNELLRILKKQKIDLQEFLNGNSDYMQNHIQGIKRAYRLLHGGINANSMYLYSGPKDKTITFIDTVRFYYKDFKIIEYRIACIYTGDGNLDEIKQIYKKYWDNVGTIQLPHHGSNNNGNFLFFDSQNAKHIFFASFGNNNNYGHPSKEVITRIYNNNCDFFPVSETRATELLETIN